VVLLHPFPTHSAFYDGILPALSTRYRVVLIDLRGHGRSSTGEGAATMARHASDVERVCRELNIGKAVFLGTSIGGYILFEFWRQFREHVSALVLCNTRAAADTQEARAGRLNSVEDIRKFGPEQFFQATMPKLVGESTRRDRPDIAEAALNLMRVNISDGVIANLLGMAERPDSTETLETINAPTLIIGGEEDTATPPDNAEQMHNKIRGSELRIIPRVGHYACMEKPEQAGKLIRAFLDSVS
jgi:3-oxoadipate enol-lactonase